MTTVILVIATLLASPPSYQASITDIVKGKHKILTRHLTPERLIVTKFSTNGKPERILLNRPLTQTEQDAMKTYCSTFPFSAVKPRYTDETAEGTLHREFYVEWCESHATIYVAHAKQPDLQRLEALIEKMLPADRTAWYDPY
jgi:hypothetical protein